MCKTMVARVGAIHPGPQNAGGWVSPRMAAAVICNTHGLALLQCGDIEANPGPVQGDSPMRTPFLIRVPSFLRRTEQGPTCTWARHRQLGPTPMPPPLPLQRQHALAIKQCYPAPQEGMPNNRHPCPVHSPVAQAHAGTCRRTPW